MDAQEGGAGSSSDGPGLSYEVTGVRQVRATALGRGTHGVPDVRRMVESQFHVAFPHRVWVAGEVGDVILGPGEQIVGAQHVVTTPEQGFAQVRPKKARATGNEDTFARGILSGHR